MKNIAILGSDADSKLLNTLTESLAGDGIKIHRKDTLLEYSANADILDRVWSSDLIVAIFSDEYFAKLRHELRLEFELIIAALNRDPGKLIPVKVRSDVTPPKYLSTLNYFNLERYGAPQLIDTIRARLAAQSRPPKGSERLTGSPNFIETLRQIFSGREVSSVSGSTVHNQSRIGYELLRIDDVDFGSKFVLHTYEPISVRSTSEHFHRHFGKIVANQKLQLIARRDRLAANDKNRLKYLGEAFKIQDATYVDDYIASRLKRQISPRLLEIPEPRAHFVEPSVLPRRKQVHALPALSFLHQWRKDGAAILVVHGSGGIGKTQLLRKFGRETAENQNVITIYVESQALLSEARRRNIILSEFSLRKIGEIAASSSEFLQGSDFALEGLLASDNVLLIIDGLDEIIPQLEASYKIQTLFASIFSTILETQGGRVLISCRNIFWPDSDVGNDSESLLDYAELLPFGKEQVDEYLGKRLPDFTLRQRFNGIFKNFSKFFQDDIPPFVLDLVCGLARDKAPIEINGDINWTYFSKSSMLDQVIWQICQREFVKFGEDGLRVEEAILEVDLQCQLFIAVALAMEQIPDYVNKNKLHHLVEATLDKKVSIALVTAFQSHPLLRVKGDAVSFNYDFIQEFFLSQALKEIILSDRKLVQEEKALHLVSHCRPHSNFLETLGRKLGPLSDEIILGILDLIKMFDTKLNKPRKLKRSRDSLPTSEEISRWQTGIGEAVNIGLQCIQLEGKWDITRTTDYIRELFPVSRENNTMRNLILIAPNFQKPFSFDFSDIIIENGRILYFDNFLRCRASKNTRFVGCYIYGGDLLKAHNIDMSLSNFDDSCHLDDGLRQLLRTRSKRILEKEHALTQQLRAFLKLFYIGGSFQKPRKVETLRANYATTGGIPFKNMLEFGIKCDLVLDNRGQGGHFVEISKIFLSDVEDFVEHGVQRRIIKKMLGLVRSG